MNRRISKKVILNEFVDDEGALVTSKVPTGSNDEIESDITTNNFAKKTRQGIPSGSTPGGRYGASFGMMAEEDESEINSAVMNAANELKVAIKTSQLSQEEILGVFKQIVNDLKNGQ